MKHSHWRVYSDEVLAPLFADGRVPTAAEIRDAYPFGDRSMLPYKCWLMEVKWFRAGCPAHYEPWARKKPIETTPIGPMFD